MERTRELEGIFPILATPFRPDGELDEISLEQLLNFLMASGVPGFALFGLAGEYYKLSDDERRWLRDAALRKTKGQLIRIVSITEHATELACQRAEEAAEAGADALMIMPPFFLNPEPAAVRYHLRQIARSALLPLIVQYSPNQTGLRLPVEFFLELASEFPHLCYVKVDSTPAGSLISTLVEKSAGRLKPLVGYAGVQMVDAFTRGAVGCMPGSSLPEPYLQIYAAWGKGNRRAATELHARFLPLINFLMQSLEFVIQCEKSILRWRGIIQSDYCRQPGWRMSHQDTSMLKELLQACVPQVAEQCRQHW